MANIFFLVVIITVAINQGKCDYLTVGRDLHNQLRRNHGSPPLTLSSKANNFAQSWANKLLNMNKREHSKRPDINENLYQSSSSDMKKEDAVRQAIKLWYDEKKDYNFQKPGHTAKAGHFEAMVWKATKELGIGFAQKKGKTIVVAAYTNPKALSGGSFADNIRPAQG